MTTSHHSLGLRGLLAAAVSLCLSAAALGAQQGPTRPQALPSTGQETGFRAVSYDVRASLAPSSQTVTATAVVEFEARQPSRLVEFELHPNLRISAIHDGGGNDVDFDRDFSREILVRANLPEPVAVGERTKLTVEYAGPLATAENSPVEDLRLAWIGNEGAYLLLPARWFPLTDYPANRYTGTFRIEVPEGYTVVGTGVAAPPEALVSEAPSEPPPLLGNRNPAGMAPRIAVSAGAGSGNAGDAPAGREPRVAYTFRTEQPEAAGTFVVGRLQPYPVQSQGVAVTVYAPASAGGTAQAYADAVARIVTVFSSQFGPLAQPSLTVAQMLDGSVPSISAPGLLLVSRRQWSEAPNERMLARLVASQWWGSRVMAATPSDTWLTDGLARYSEAVYAEQAENQEAMSRAIEDFAIGALMFEDAAPVAEAGRLQPFSPAYTSVVVNKGAMIFHMLRAQMGDGAFFSLLRDFYVRFAGREATLSDFQEMAQARAAQARPAAPSDPSSFVLRPTGDGAAPGTGSGEAAGGSGTPNLRPFFAQWLNSTGVPEFQLEYTVYRTRQGFRVVGKVKQNLDFFRMPVEVEIQTEGNPEVRTIEVSGTESTFEADVFGQPRPNGILLDPRNQILKSSGPLKVRAMIARGEALAEQGRYYDAIQQYQQALDADNNNALANFRMGEAFFYQKNYSAAATAFRNALDGNLERGYRWVEVWSHIYLGKIYDVSGDRTRAVNEYSRAEQTNDDTGGAQAEARKYLNQPYTEGSS